MADSKVKTLLGAVITALVATAKGSASKPTNLQVVTRRKRPAHAKELPQLLVLANQDAPDPNEATTRTTPALHRQFRVSIICRAVGDDAAVEPLRAWALQQIMADVSLGGVALGVTEDATSWAADADSEADYSEATMDFLVGYARDRGVL